ncbi:putative NBD/HSP70 family sugar kinase [Sphingobacterium alimentarium]|uniref:Putative NBD/HSP70 family sugar kinase n=1 Tax=Sphingobacterium alimentarium TaxID=797292 RepID=A0A4R3VV47_9SPHI|nr:ROK family transcriptional regulator [Sphingobacterium alimentarium]TCV10878.1 putative NBD/HSP70 family sugar kinase [Sphingobacterium alimentarium]
MTSNFFKHIHEANKNGVAYKNIRLKKKILAYFATRETATIAELSKEFNISIPKINESVTELIQDELVKDYGKTTSAVGRKPNTYGLVANAAYFIGVQVGVDNLSISMINMKKDIVSQKDNILYSLQNNEESLLDICKEINEFISKHSIVKEKILGVGINLTGRINYRTGYSYSYFNFYENPLSELFEQNLGIPTFLENDTKALSYAEFNSGTLADEKDALFVNVDNGIGLGILIDGKLYYGKSGFSGEFGHISIFDNDIICKCGKKGCLETEASGYALIRRVTDEINNGATSILTKKFKKTEDIKLNDIISAAKKDDNLCIESINYIGDKLGRGIASLINIFNPELIIIGGVVAKCEEYLSLPLKNAVNKYSLSSVNRDTKIILSSKSDNLASYGACLLLRDRLLNVTD